METHEAVIVLGTNISYIGVGARWKMGDAVEFEDRLIKAHMLSENCIAHSSVFVRKSVLDKYGITYDETYRQSQDYRLWEMLREKGKFACLREKLLQYRLSAQQITNSSSGKQKGLADATRLRLQKAWLKSVGVLYSDNDLENHPAIVLDELRKRSDLKSQPEYRMFVHYVYMNSPESIGFVHSLLSGDITYLSHLNRIRIFVKMLKK